MIVDKRVTVVLMLGIVIWYLCGFRNQLRELADVCFMIELASRTYTKKES